MKIGKVGLVKLGSSVQRGAWNTSAGNIRFQVCSKGEFCPKHEEHIMFDGQIFWEKKDER